MTKKIKLSDLFKIGSSKRVLKAQWQTSGVPFYRGREITKLSQNGFVENDLFISEELYSEYATKHGVPTAGDIVITAIGTIGNSYIVREEDRFYFKDASVLWLKRNSDVESKYINLWLKSSLMKEQLDQGNGATVDTLTIKKLQGLTLKLPPLPEQKRIVAILDKAFADLEQVRAKTEQNLKNARDLFDSYLQQVFSQDREVAAKSGWVTKYISDVICKTKTVDPRKSPESEFLYVDVSGVSNQTLEITDSTKLAGKDAPSRARRVITEGDIIFATVRPTLRRIAVVPSHLDGEVCSTGYFVFQPKSELYNRYLYYFLQSDTFMVEMEKLQKGASYPAVNDSQVKSRLISYPSIPEQKRIVETLDSLNNAVNELKATYTKKLNSIDDLKKSILQKAFSGELTTTAT